MQKLSGKTALITGGGRGIAAAIARALASEGAHVTITYANSEKRAHAVVAEIERAGGKACAIHADNKVIEDIKAAITHVVDRQGQFDILINNAGVFHAAPIDQLSQENYDDTMNVNVRAVFFATQAAATQIADGGRIITIGSNLAKRVPTPGLSLYSLSKAALVGLTKGAARDLGARNITVNIVHPGPTDTEMNPANGEMSDALRNLMAIKRFNSADEVAAMVTWLAGPDAGTVTGAEFTIDGGSNI
jgi:3-oxoacyl-[acyl-carrier protein] reductase